MWNMKCMVIPEINGVTEMVTKRLKKKLKAIAGKYSIDSLQKTDTSIQSVPGGMDKTSGECSLC